LSKTEVFVTNVQTDLTTLVSAFAKPVKPVLFRLISKQPALLNGAAQVVRKSRKPESKYG
jgi:hypothetical protein